MSTHNEAIPAHLAPQRGDLVLFENRLLERLSRIRPGTVLGVWLGVKAYGRVDDRQFRLIVLWLLLASGGVLTVTNLL